MLHTHSKTLRPHQQLPLTPRLVAWALLISLMIVLIPPTVSAISSNLTPAASVATNSSVDASVALLRSDDPRVRELAIPQLARAARNGSSEATDALVTFFQRDEFWAAH